MEKGSKKEKSAKWTITTDDTVPVDDVVKELKKLGLKKVSVMEEIGIITGTATEKEMKKLVKVNGVSDIAKEIEYQLPDPDAPETF